MKLLNTNHYLLLIDEEAEIKEEKLVVRVYGDDIKVAKSLPNSDNLKRLKDKRVFLLIAYYPLNSEAKELDLPLLPPFEEDNNIEKMAKNSCSLCETDISYLNIWIRGYKAAQSKQFSLEDMKRAIEMAREIKDNGDIFDIDSIRGLTEVCTYDWEERYSEEEIIQSLSTQQLPKEFIPQYDKINDFGEPYTYDDMDFGVEIEYKLKTITNSEGKEVLVGTYKY